MRLYTIGHSNRTLEFFISLLLGYGIQCLVDVRTIPRSRRNPQFNREDLSENLRKVGIGYKHEAKLGGLRHPLPGSVNEAWENASFRGFADYMHTAKFHQALAGLIRTGRRQRAAILCAEAVPWRCHRSLIADALRVRRVQVRHIMSRVRAPLHRLTPWIRVRGTKISYPLPLGKKRRAIT